MIREESQDNSADPISAVYIAGMETVPGHVDDERFLALTREMTAASPCVVLLSGGAVETARYSIAAWDPARILTAKARDCELWFDAQFYTFESDPLNAIDALLASIRRTFPLAAKPFCGGLIGYISYELKNVIETLPQTSQPDEERPDLWLMLPAKLLIHDRLEESAQIIEFDYVDADDRLLLPLQMTHFARFAPAIECTSSSSFSHDQYCEAVRRVIRHIADGDVYQINLSQRIRTAFHGDAFEFWSRLYRDNPAPHYAFVNTGEYAILSTSMERFLCRNGDHIQSQPIKGTRRRGTTTDEDVTLREDLLRHPKDDAELSMIVDLVRNDLGRICKPGTVNVAEHKRIDAYRNVFHLSSIVEGTLRQDVEYRDILRAAFPAGSITGCPKIRAMELIDAFEPVARHVYTGSIGYFGFHKNMDLSVAIRTALLKDGALDFAVGGGIVYDSDPEEEYMETIDKGRSFFEVLNSFNNEHHG
jgi:para-aminobenzoate synthetase component I